MMYRSGEVGGGVEADNLSLPARDHKRSVMPMLTLQDVTGQNWVDCTRLSLHDHQLGYVASNVATIAESKYEQHHQLRAIYNGEQLVGMLAYCHEADPDDVELYWIFRLMIAKDHQRNGFAAGAIKLALLEIRQLGGKRIRTMHKPENIAASALYSKLEFHAIGSLDDGDILLEHNFDCSHYPRIEPEG